MRKTAIVAGIALSLAACNRNTAIGNDREAQLDPAPKPASIEAASAALRNVAPEIVKPETMTDADVEALGGKKGRCIFRLTEVGYPAFLYEPGRQGAIKLNGKLIPVTAKGAGQYTSGDLVVRLRLLDEEGDSAGLREQEMIVVPPGAKDELGYHGYVTCTDITRS